jgi:hypothetical protein
MVRCGGEAVAWLQPADRPPEGLSDLHGRAAIGKGAGDGVLVAAIDAVVDRPLAS